MRGDLIHSRRVKCIVINLWLHKPTFEESFNFRRKDEVFIVPPIIERLYSKAISRREQSAGLVVPYCKCEHSIEHLQAFSPPLFVRTQDHFSIRVGYKTVPFVREYIPNLSVVVNLPVVCDPKSAFTIGHWLMPERRQIQNAQPCVAKCHMP